MTNTALGDNVIGKMLYIAHIAFKHADFQAVLMIDMYVQRRYRQIVVVVLGRDQPAGEVAFLMFIHIGEHRKALSAVLLGGFLGQGVAQNVANRFRTIMVTAALAQIIEGGQ